jgi:hypothetical protein
MPINTQFFVLFHGNRTQAQAISLHKGMALTIFAEEFINW